MSKYCLLDSDTCNLSMLPDYENNVYAEYISETKKNQGLLFVHDHGVQEGIRVLKEVTAKPNPFVQFHDQLVYESREI